MYTATEWCDDVYDAVSGELIQEGTPVDAPRLNKMEQGIKDAHELMETGEVTMTNTAEYPFNDSFAKIPLKKTRSKLDYQVYWEVLEATGPVGNVIVRARRAGMFEANYTGSATNATLRYFVTGGF